MYKHDHSKNLANAVRASAAFCALTAVSGGAAHAQVTFINNYNQLTNPVRTTQYPEGPLTGTNAFVVPPMFTVPTVDGSNNLTFTATNGNPAGGFQSNLANAAVAPEFSDPTMGGKAFDVIEDTDFNGSASSIPTAPLLIQFQNPVSGFGLLAQDFLKDNEIFTLNVFADANATVSLGTFTYNSVPNLSSAGTAVFVGAVSNTGLPLFRSATLSSVSDNSSSNDFFFGPTQVKAPVPEASTVVSFGMGITLFAGLALVARKRKVGGASQAA